MVKSLKKGVDTRVYDAELHVAFKVLECCKWGRCGEAKAAIREAERLIRYLERAKRGGEREEKVEKADHGKGGVKIDDSNWRQQEIEF